MVGRRPGLEHLGQNKKERPQPPGPQKDGMPPRAGMPGADQLERVPTPQSWSVRGKVAARGEGNRRPRPRWGSGGDKTRSNAKDKAEEMQGGREVDEAEETQGNKDEDRGRGAAAKQTNG